MITLRRKSLNFIFIFCVFSHSLFLPIYLSLSLSLSFHLSSPFRFRYRNTNTVVETESCRKLFNSALSRPYEIHVRRASTIVPTSLSHGDRSRQSSTAIPGVFVPLIIFATPSDFDFAQTIQITLSVFARHEPKQRHGILRKVYDKNHGYA